MNLMLDSLYRYAMETSGSCLLTPDELRDYRSAVRSIEDLSVRLERLLDGESLRLFRLYAENRSEEANYDELSMFRKGLAMGLKLGALALSEW